MSRLAPIAIIVLSVSTARADDDALFAGEAYLDRAALVKAVLARNPDVAAAEAAVDAARARARGAAAFADPMLSYGIAPLSVVGDAPLGHRVELRQRLPFPGKRAPERAAAAARADAARADVDVMRLELAQMASDMYDDYYVVARAHGINEHHRKLAAELEESAAAQYVVGRASQQDPLMARSKAAELARVHLELGSERDEVIAQINGLLHRAPDAALPPPPLELTPAPMPAGPLDELLARAVERRPQRAVVRARIRAAQAEVAMARSERRPDFELMASYESMPVMPEHRWMVGVMIELPVQRGRRNAAIDAAGAEQRQMQREDDKLVDAIRVEVARAFRRVTAAEDTVELDDTTLVPTAQARLDAARAGFIANQNDFVAVIDADEMLRQVELEREMARAELSRRRAALARAVGDVPGLPAGGGAP